MPGVVRVDRIRTFQMRARELGRIRLGQYVKPSGGGKGRPAKIETFRFTSQSHDLLAKVAHLYGGQVKEWTPQGGKVSAFEVYSDATRVPILLPPQPVSQAFELWKAGGCARRCDGEREIISDSPCLCSPEPEERECKPTTRMNVVLSEVEGIGVWRLETHGFYAATELPAVAEFLAGAQSNGGYLPAHLILEQRSSRSGGKLKEFLVPAIEVEGVTPAQLMAGGTSVAQLPTGGSDLAELERGTAAVALAEGGAQFDMDSFRYAVNDANTQDDLRDLWRMAHMEKLGGVAFDLINDRVEKLRAESAAASAPPPHTEEPPPDPEQNPEPPHAGSRQDVDALWQTVLLTVPEDMPTSEVEADFTRVTGAAIAHASAEDMNRYLEHLADQDPASA